MQYTNFNWEGACFLIADDDVYSHLLLDKVFKKTGARIIHAYNGIEAVDLALDNKDIALALIDIIMPGFNGYEVAKKIKNSRPDIICVAYTADIMSTQRSTWQDAGFAKCLLKPLLPVRLFAEIQTLIPIYKAL